MLLLVVSIGLTLCSFHSASATIWQRIYSTDFITCSYDVDSINLASSEIVDVWIKKEYSKAVDGIKATRCHQLWDIKSHQYVILFLISSGPDGKTVSQWTPARMTGGTVSPGTHDWEILEAVARHFGMGI